VAVYQVGIVKITNRTPGFMEYVKKAAELLAKYDAEYLVRGPADTILDGDYLKGAAMVVTKWPSLEKAKEYWNCEEYQKNIKPLREGAGVIDIGLYNEAPK
jgi:uncharacterized protein (DUF1330 family)